MSWQPCDDPQPGDRQACDLIDVVIVPRARDLGGFEVRRALPSPQRRMVGPFIFFDQMGPAEFLLGQGIDVRPHPHIGLATVTYLFDGEIMHRDTLGTVQPIRPGERQLDDRRPRHRPFRAHRAGAAPQRLASSSASRAGSRCRPRTRRRRRLSRTTPPARCRSSTARARRCGSSPATLFGAALAGAGPRARCSMPMWRSRPGAALPLDAEHEERAIYIVDPATIEHRRRRVRPGPAAGVPARRPHHHPGRHRRARFLLLGGEPMDGPRHIWWNFVSSRKDRIEQAKADWRAGNSTAFRATASSFRCRTGCPAMKPVGQPRPLDIGHDRAKLYGYSSATLLVLQRGTGITPPGNLSGPRD